MNATVYGRTLVGDSLGFHILFALLGVGIPALMLGAELIGLLRKDKRWLATAQDWSRVLAVLFVAGAVSGTIISIQFGAVWPRFMAIASQVVGLSFFLEGFAFMIEALFFGIYLLTWKRLGGTWIHWLLGLPAALAALASAFFITTVNSWMNNPQGFAYHNGQVSNIHPIAAVFNPATATETSHSIVAYYLASAALFATWYAWRSRRQKPDAHQRQVLTALVVASLVLALGVGATGDASAKYLAHQEPIKLAAAEALFTTQSNAPLTIGGIVTQSTVHGAIQIPGLLSWLSFGSTHAVVKGLNSVSPEFWPPLFIHYCFDTMVVIGILMLLLPIIYLGLTWRKRWPRAATWAVILGGPLAIVAVEVGWMLTEIGRQPYAIRGVLFTNDAITTSNSMIQAAAIFPCLYVVLLIASVFVLRRLPGARLK